jgi:hypothetical protein
LLNDKTIKNYCKDEDTFQDVWVKILLIPEKRIIEIYNTGGLKYYVIRMIQTHLIGLSKKKVTLIDIESLQIAVNEETRTDAKIDIQFAKKVVKNEHEAEKEIFNLYLKFESVRKVAEATGIHYTTIFAIVKDFKELIKNGLR